MSHITATDLVAVLIVIEDTALLRLDDLAGLALEELNVRDVLAVVFEVGGDIVTVALAFQRTYQMIALQCPTGLFVRLVVEEEHRLVFGGCNETGR